jgi:hypothetical protein
MARVKKIAAMQDLMDRAGIEISRADRVYAKEPREMPADAVSVLLETVPIARCLSSDLDSYRRGSWNYVRRRAVWRIETQTVSIGIENQALERATRQ